MSGHLQRYSEGISCPKYLGQTLWASYLAGIRGETASLLHFCQVRAFPLFIA